MQLKMQQEILIIRGRILGKYILSQCHELSFQKTNYVYLKNYLGSETWPGFYNLTISILCKNSPNTICTPISYIHRDLQWKHCLYNPKVCSTYMLLYLEEYL
jgi:hypothetical protein